MQIHALTHARTHTHIYVYILDLLSQKLMVVSRLLWENCFWNYNILIIENYSTPRWGRWCPNCAIPSPAEPKVARSASQLVIIIKHVAMLIPCSSSHSRTCLWRHSDNSNGCIPTLKWQVYEIITVSQSTVQSKVIPFQTLPAILSP